MAASIEEVSGMSETLAASVEQTSTSIEELAQSIQSVAQNSETIKQASAEATTSVAQLDQASRNVNGLVKRTEEISHRVSRQAEEGGQTIQKSIEGIAKVAGTMTQSTTVMRELNKRTRDITGIVGTIETITERTNLLSLNASIEAARAGEAGRGFAVVAEEIRNLADRCAKATAEIVEIVRGLEDATREATEVANSGARARRRKQPSFRVRAGGFENDFDRHHGEFIAGDADQPRLRRANYGGEKSGRVDHHHRRDGERDRHQHGGAGKRSGSKSCRPRCQMRKGAKEVSQANNEQAKAARGVIKSAQTTTNVARPNCGRQ